MNDIIVIENNISLIDDPKAAMNIKFKIKDLENLKYFLDIEVAKSSKQIHIFQCKYLSDLLKDSGSLGSKSSKLQLDQNIKLSKDHS